MSKKNFVSLILGTVGGTVNTKVGEIAGEVGMTPVGWNGGIFNMIRGLSETCLLYTSWSFTRNQCESIHSG